jgi:hypothetical protein
MAMNTEMAIAKRSGVIGRMLAAMSASSTSSTTFSTALFMNQLLSRCSTTVAFTRSTVRSRLR